MDVIPPALSALVISPKCHSYRCALSCHQDRALSVVKPLVRLSSIPAGELCANHAVLPCGVVWKNELLNMIP